MLSALKQKEDYLSKNNTNALKGILAVLVILHHISQRASIFPNNPFIHGIFLNLGYLCVGGFFFISGYGLICSYKTNGDKYLNNIIPKKILPLYFLCFVVSLVYMILEEDFSKRNILKLFYKIGDYGFLWYFSSILLFYGLFFIIHKLKISDNIKFFLLTTTICLYCCIVSVHSSEQPWKIYSLAAFILGYSWFYLKDDFDKFLGKSYNYCITISLLLIVFIGMIALGHFCGTNYFVKMLLSGLFPLMFILITYKITLNNVVTKLLGNISLELYLFQFLIIYIYRNVFNIANNLLYILLVFNTVIIFACIIHPFIKLYMIYSGKLFCKIKDVFFTNKHN